MKALFTTSVNAIALNVAILILRLVGGGFMLTHGVGKLEKLMAGGEIKFADPFGIGPAPSLALAVFAEVVCAVLIVLGLGTRLASIPLIITMAVAAFIAHGDDPFAQKEKALLFLAIYLVLLLVGSGKFSADKALGR
jgi:putative oxidoreductase